MNIISTFKAPNGVKIGIYDENNKLYMKCIDIAKAIGMHTINYDNSKLAIAAKINNVNILTKNIKGCPSFVIEVSEVPIWLKNFIDLTLLPDAAKGTNHERKLTDWRMESEKLLQSFNNLSFLKNNKIVMAYKITTQTLLETKNSYYETGAMKMENLATLNPIPSQETEKEISPTSKLFVLTAKEIEVIGQNAEVTAKIFGATKKAALRAAVQLKAQEINRDLTPLLDLLESI